MSNRGNFPPNPYARGMPGWRGDPRHNSPGGMRFPGTPRHHSPRGYSPSPQGQSASNMVRGWSHDQSPHHGGSRPRFSPSHQYQQSPYTPGGHRGRGGHGRGGRGSPYGGSPGGRNNTPYSGGRGRGPGGHGARGGGRIEQYYKHSMVEDPWRQLVENSQTGNAS